MSAADDKLTEALAAVDVLDRAELICDVAASGDKDAIKRVAAAANKLGDAMLPLDLLAETRRRRDPELLAAIYAAGFKKDQAT